MKTIKERISKLPVFLRRRHIMETWQLSTGEYRGLVDAGILIPVNLPRGGHRRRFRRSHVVAVLSPELVEEDA